MNISIKLMLFCFFNDYQHYQHILTNPGLHDIYLSPKFPLVWNKASFSLYLCDYWYIMFKLCQIRSEQNCD